MSQKTSNTLLHCDSCGEDYSSTYRRCPFCGSKGAKPKETVSVEDEYVFDGGYIFDEIDREASEKASREQQSGNISRSGKRVASSTAAGSGVTSSSPERSRTGSSSTSGEKSSHPDVRTTGARPRTSHSRLDAFDEFLERNNLTLLRLIGLVFSLLVIIAAFVILFTVIIPMFSNDSGPNPNGTNSGSSQTGAPSPSGSGEVSLPSDSPTTSPAPSASGTDIPADQTATDFKLSLNEFAISDRWPQPVTIRVTLIPANSKGTISWTSSNEKIATVDQNGTVTAVSKGSATITAALPGGKTHTCKVYVNISESPTSSTQPDPSTTPSVSPEPSVSPSVSPEPSTSPSVSPEPSTSPSVSPEPSTPVTKPLTLSKTEFTISDQWPQPVTLRVSNASGEVIWSTSDPTVAIVDSNGKVSGISKGRCTITVTDAAGNTAECTVRCTFS